MRSIALPALPVNSRESMQGFADTFIPVISLEDEPLHTPINPFCYDATCSCHENQERIDQAAQQVQNGLFTPQEATDFVAGKML